VANAHFLPRCLCCLGVSFSACCMLCIRVHVLGRSCLQTRAGTCARPPGPELCTTVCSWARSATCRRPSRQR
jgi:hypothetical protein